MDKTSWAKVSRDMTSQFDILLITNSDLNNGDESNSGSHYKYHKILKDELSSLGFKVTATNSLDSVQNEIKQNTFVYGIHSHSWFNGKELFTSAISEFLSVPYLGPRPTVRALAEDKKLSKLLALSLNIPVPESVEIKKGELPSKIKIPPPWILKPRNGIASQFIFHCADAGQLEDNLFSIPEEVLLSTDFLIEKFIPGINLTVPIIDGVSDQQNDFVVFHESDVNDFNILSHHGKRGVIKGYSSVRYEGDFLDEVIRHTKAIREKLGDIDYGRIDFRCDPLENRIYFLEVNLICNMAQGAAIGKLAKEYGVSYHTLVEHVIANSIDRQTR